MPENVITANEMVGEEDKEAASTAQASECPTVSRTERRKAAKKEKRKKKRQETAVLALQEEADRLNDPDEQLRLQAAEEMEKKIAENERREFEERERTIQEAWARKRSLEEEKEEKRRKDWEEQQSMLIEVGYENEVHEDEYEYVEGPPEIIWQGNEIIVKKKKVRVKKKDPDLLIVREDPGRPTSNPLPPQSEAFADYKSASIPSAQQLLESFAQQTPNFGTEQDKAHCPFHLKTGACRFGSRCSRIHFYPDKSCTFLIKNMYNGPGLAWEQDEGLEYTDEEVERAYEEFYEDVHTEFLKFGEIVNFKVCRNGSSHLRGNVYVQYKNLDSAELAYYSVNGRYFGGKQLHCEFVGVMKWKVAICGEYMKSKFTTCSRGMACNFIHCFRNPGGDYEWADWDKPPPKFWVKKMASLFGYSDESVYSKQTEEGSPRLYRDTSKCPGDAADRQRSGRSRSKESGYSRSSRNYSESYTQRSARQHRRSDRKQIEFLDEKPSDKMSISRLSCSKNSSSDSESDRDSLDRGFRDKLDGSSRKRSRVHSTGKLETQDHQCDGKRTCETISISNSFDNDRYDNVYHKYANKSTEHRDRRHGTLDEGRCAGSIGESSDEEGHNTTDESGRKNRRQQKKSKAPVDFWYGNSRNYDIDVNSDCSNGERGPYSSHIHNKKSSRSVNCEVFEDDKPQINSPSNLMDSVTREYLGRQDEEGEAENAARGNRAWRCKTSDSNSRSASMKDTGKQGHIKSKNHFLSNTKKSKRKRDGDKSLVLEHNGRRSHLTAFGNDENLVRRGRWEPDEVD